MHQAGARELLNVWKTHTSGVRVQVQCGSSVRLKEKNKSAFFSPLAVVLLKLLTARPFPGEAELAVPSGYYLTLVLGKVGILGKTGQHISSQGESQLLP